MSYSTGSARPSSPAPSDLTEAHPVSPKKARSAPSASIPHAQPEQADAQPDNGPNISNLSSIIARVMITARFIFSGAVDVVGTLNDMLLMEKCTKKLAKQFERLTNAIKGTAQAIGEVGATLPSIAEATVRVGNTFSQAFPFVKRFFA